MNRASSTHLPARRKFIRLSGGGVIAAALPAAGCTGPAAIPDSAIAAWRGPDDSIEIRRWALSWAILAPNPHNRQPWQVSLEGGDRLTLSLDTDRLLPETDPYGRQTMIGTGAMLGLLALAAAQRGHGLEVSEFPEGAPGPVLDARPVARVRFIASAGPTQAQRELFAQVSRRHTHRGRYDPERAPGSGFLDRSEGSPGPAGLIEGVIDRRRHGARFDALDAIAREAWRLELSTPRTMLESVRLLRIGAAEIDRYRDGITITSPLLVALNALGLVDREHAPDIDSMSVRGQVADFDAAMDSTPGLYWLLSDGNGRRDQLAAGRAYLRAQLAATASGLVMQPISQALQEYPEMRALHGRVHAQVRGHAGGRPDATVQMLCRLGRPAADAGSIVPAPRRGLAAHLRA
ncbi:MAG: twin-arginine translocation pathway signal protein [Burkholderiaceae bacterium]|nr:twin-arginine translocation pathway signal protein [Burkholderiaceae bacterium]